MEADMVTNASNLRSQEAEAGRLYFEDFSQLLNEFEDTLKTMRACFQTPM